MKPDPIKYAKNRAYQFNEEQQQALDEGRITEEQWFELHYRFFTRAYLLGENPRAQSGHSGDERAYRYTQGMILEAIERDGSFLDVGCANGYLIEKINQWLQGTGLTVDFYGLDISPELVELAKKRLPQWNARFFLGNALYWMPARKFDYVCVRELAYVPRNGRRAFFEHMVALFLEKEGRLILGPFSEERGKYELEAELESWGYPPTGFCIKSHQRNQALGTPIALV
jgi:SAM-dependent methyltransferase